MLHTVFHFRGNDFKGNRVPESYEHLIQAAYAIRRQVNMRESSENDEQNYAFNFTFITKQNTEERPIIDDKSMIEAI